MFVERNKEIKANIKNAKLGKLLENYTLSAEVKERVRREDEEKRTAVKEGTMRGEAAE